MCYYDTTTFRFALLLTLGYRCDADTKEPLTVGHKLLRSSLRRSPSQLVVYRTLVIAMEEEDILSVELEAEGGLQALASQSSLQVHAEPENILNQGSTALH